MFGFSWKRFLVTLGVSVGVWVVTNFVQLFSSSWPAGFSLLGGACTVTGYPLAFCFSAQEKAKIIPIYFINILIWFWVLHFAWNFFDKRRKQTKRCQGDYSSGNCK